MATQVYFLFMVQSLILLIAFTNTFINLGNISCISDKVNTDFAFTGS